MFTCGSLFAGMGGLCLGMEKAGFKTLWANEFNDDCLNVYKLNFPNTKLVPSDIREVSVSSADLQPVDVLHGGFDAHHLGGGKELLKVVRLSNIHNINHPLAAVLFHAILRGGQIGRRVEECTVFFANDKGALFEP